MSLRSHQHISAEVSTREAQADFLLCLHCLRHTSSLHHHHHHPVLGSIFPLSRQKVVTITCVAISQALRTLDSVV